MDLAVVPGVASAVEQQYRASGDTTDARLIATLAAQPTASWFGKGTPSAVQQAVQSVIHQAAGRSPVLVAYDIPDRDCGGYSGGGATGATEYAAWIAGFTRGLEDAPAIIILEPDAIPQALPEAGCQAFDSSSAQQARYAMLAGAVTTLTSDPQAHVYLDAGNAGWIMDKSALAAALRSSGIDHAAGFTLNVSTFFTTADSIAYGDGLSADLGGAHFIVDTSRNGAGPYDPPAGDTTPAQCNPPGRKLGSNPTTSTGQPLVDAYLWIKIPGESDGTCRGGPTAGQWWPSYALALVRDSTQTTS